MEPILTGLGTVLGAALASYFGSKKLQSKLLLALKRVTRILKSHSRRLTVIEIKLGIEPPAKRGNGKPKLELGMAPVRPERSHTEF